MGLFSDYIFFQVSGSFRGKKKTIDPNYCCLRMPSTIGLKLTQTLQTKHVLTRQLSQLLNHQADATFNI